MTKMQFKYYRTNGYGFGVMFRNIAWFKGVTVYFWNWSFHLFREDEALRNAICSGGDFS